MMSELLGGRRRIALAAIAVIVEVAALRSRRKRAFDDLRMTSAAAGPVTNVRGVR